jgi:iron complex transport system substrate-binding protein
MLAVLAGLAGCKSQSPAPVSASRPATADLRIVSLAPSVTEMLFGLGLGWQIVGATNYCDYPPEAQKIARVGALGTPNIEQLLAAKPDLVIATEFQNKEMPATLRQMGISVHLVQVNNIADVLAAFATLGQLTGREANAAVLVKTMQSQLDEAARRFANVPRPRRPRVFVEIASEPLMTAGKASFVNDLVERAGGVNVAGELDQAYPKISAEKLVEWNPDVIVLGSMGPPGQGKAQLAGRIGFAGIAAVKNGRVIDDISPDLFLRPGPRLVQGVTELSKRLHPQKD